jgi:putative ABC transport system substrate-binding protein
MKRREFAGAAAALLSAMPARAQGTPPLVGTVRVGSAANEQFAPTFRRDMARLGFEEGKAYRLKVLFADGNTNRLPELTAELVKQPVDILVVFGNPGVEAAQQATKTIPIIGMADDLAGSNLVASITRPGGNTTGVSIMGFELDPKRLEVLHELVPQAKRIAVIHDPNLRAGKGFGNLQPAADKLGLKIVEVQASKPDDLPPALARLKAGDVEAVQFLASPFLQAQRGWFIEHLRELKLPGMFEWPETVEEGGLVSYAPRLTLVYRHVAVQVAKLLKGAKPAELPTEQPSTFTLAINSGTAKAIGLPIPEAMLVRADLVVD